MILSKKLYCVFLKKNCANIQHPKSALTVFSGFSENNFQNRLYIPENEQQKISKIFIFFLAIMNFRVTLQPFSQNQKVNQSIKHAYLFRKNTPIFRKIRSCKIGANRK